MKSSTIPFNKFLGIQNADTHGYILQLPNKDEYHNHLGTIHASAIFSLAESSSGEFLWNNFKEYDLDVIPVVRKAEIKYSKPGHGVIRSTAEFLGTDEAEIHEQILTKGRILFRIKVEIHNSERKKIATALFDWFITKNN